MTVTAAHLKQLIHAELETLSDIRVKDHVMSLLVEAEGFYRDRDYGDERHICWTVLAHPASNTGIAYCEEGFGPKCPWGLVWLKGDDKKMSMGMDSGWYPSFLDAYFESFAPAELPIWRVMQGVPGVSMTPISGEQAEDAAWAQVERLRAEHPEEKYYVGHTISYGKPRKSEHQAEGNLT